jgi:hypothetical protein
MIIRYSVFFILRLDFSGYIFYLIATIEGVLGIWGKEKNFLK